MIGCEEGRDQCWKEKCDNELIVAGASRISRESENQLDQSGFEY